jgi:hypothetical protein
MKRITFFIISILCFTACNNEIVIEQPKPEQTGQIKLIVPDAEKVSVYSTATPSECMIDTLWVIAFRSNAKIWAEKIDVSKIVKNGQAIQLLPQLAHHKEIETGDLVYIVANVSPTDTALLLTNSDINTVFPLNKPYYSGGDYLPMFGEMTWSAFDFTCTMTRAVAKVQVQMGTNVSDATVSPYTAFTAENVSFKIYNSARGGHIRGSSYPILGPFIDSTSTKRSFDLIQKSGATESQTNAYIYEYPSSSRTGLNSITPISDDDFNKDRQYIVLEVDNSAWGSDPKYYRLDFYNAISRKFIDTKRNHNYLFTINKVRSIGYDNPHDLPGSNIEYTIKVDDESTYIVSNGQYAIAVSSDTIYLTNPGPHTNITVATARYILPQEMPTLAANTNNSIGLSHSEIIPSNSMTFGSPFTNKLSDTNNEIKITTQPGFQKGRISMYLGNIRATITIIQQ